MKISTNFNVNELTKSYINAVINVKSITTEIESRDKHLLKEDYFDETNYNTIQLESTKIEKQQEGIFLLFANLTIKGITKKIKVPLEVTIQEPEPSAVLVLVASYPWFVPAFRLDQSELPFIVGFGAKFCPKPIIGNINKNKKVIFFIKIVFNC